MSIFENSCCIVTASYFLWLNQFSRKVPISRLLLALLHHIFDYIGCQVHLKNPCCIVPLAYFLWLNWCSWQVPKSIFLVALLHHTLIFYAASSIFEALLHCSFGLFLRVASIKREIPISRLSKAEVIFGIKSYMDYGS